MFKKFKDKLAEEVKSSPQRLQQFAQAAQAAVTSASSSISDITNNDLFSIGDSDSATKSQSLSNSQQSTFRDASPVYQASIQSGSDLGDSIIMQEENQRQRRLSNSSFASDVSFRLPSYESPSMYHLQSDMEVSASEAEEKGFNGSTVNLDRVTKEQLYSAYRHTQDRCKKYKTQYADLARHYKLLERENAKARNVLVETQDKALRRISELREQCLLEQNAKAHLERALRIDIDEKNMKIHALNTKLDLLQNNPVAINENSEHNTSHIDKETDAQLINLNDNEQKVKTEDSSPLQSEITTLNTKLEKMEQLLNKYKESLKVAKEKNAQMTTEIQILSNDVQTKSKEIESLQSVSVAFTDSKKKIQELNDIIEELQNKCNTYEFAKNKETSILEINLQSAHEDIAQLQSKIEELKKKEEEYAISLAENKLSIHKELESKEAEIKSLKDSLAVAQNEIQSLHIIIDDYKNNIVSLESERLTLKSDVNELTSTKSKIKDLEVELEELLHKCQSLESSKAKLDEQYKCLQLQMKQETAEKLAMIDRNTYLEDRNAKLTEENTKKSSQITNLESELEAHVTNKSGKAKETDSLILKEITMWKTKYENLEKEIQDEREELIKLQSEIEKLLRNYELVQTKNDELIISNSNLTQDIIILQEQISNMRILITKYSKINENVKELREILRLISNDSKESFKFVRDDIFCTINDKILLFNEIFKQETDKYKQKYNELNMNYDLLEKEMFNISNKYKETVQESHILKEENNNYKSRSEQYKSEILEMEKQTQSAAVQHKRSLEEINLLKEELEKLNNKVKDDTKHHVNVHENLKILEIENRNLQNQLTESKNNIKLLTTDLNKEKELYEEKLKSTVKKNEDSLSTITVLKEEIHDLKLKIESSDKQYLNKVENMKTLEINNRNLIDKLTENENCIQLLNTTLQEEKDSRKEKIEELSVLSNNYASVLKDNEEKKMYIHNLEENITHLTQENSTLKNLAETISDNVNKLEYEINEVRVSHTEIEKEKNHLSSIIDQLEKSQLEHNSVATSDMDSQTDLIYREKLESGLVISVPRESSTTDGVNCATQLLEEKVGSTVNNSEKSDVLNEEAYQLNNVEQKYNILKNDYEVLKEENRRLQSDVEGLQIYLTKISKENSALNDKLREYFASAENLPDKNGAICHDIEELKTEIQCGKEKIDSLTRENTILIEENLELKDQIQSQSYVSYPETKTAQLDNNTERELLHIKEKYKNVLDAKSNSEKRLVEVEEMNQSVTENMHHLQVSNEKLRLCNEKLERRLDEALVSLRHLHALQENTELEYLRNILYEYLTGSGAHSLTLAKVLSAVVKFNDSQTDLVLQKERERQGFLRQLGLL